MVIELKKIRFAKRQLLYESRILPETTFTATLFDLGIQIHLTDASKNGSSEAYVQRDSTRARIRHY